LVYPVQSGDSLSLIAARLRVPLAVLVEKNRLRNPDLIVAGHGLLVPENTPYTDGLSVYEPIPDYVQGDPLSCEVTAWSEPSARKADGFCSTGEDYACAKGPGGALVCSCVEDSTAGTIARYTLRQGRRVLATWTSSLFTEASRFSVVSRDLDQDGQPEILVRTLQSVSNGLAVDSWENHIITKEGARTSFVSVGESLPVQAGGACELLARDREYMTDALRGPGLYFFTRRFAFAGGVLQGRSEVFPAERVGYPMRQAWPVDPLLYGRKAETQARGEVVGLAVAQAPGLGEVLEVRLRWSDGREETWREGFSSEENPRAFFRVGERSSGMVYPEGYRPGARGAWVGRRVSLVRYEEGASGFFVVWLEA
jgi:hypothetical protein